MKVVFPDPATDNFSPVAVVVSGDPGSFVGEACVFSTFTAVKDRTYHIGVADFFGRPGGGTGHLVVATPPPPPTLALTVDGVGTVDRSTNTVAVGGTATCTSADPGTISGQLRQVVGRHFINGFLFADLGACDGNAHRWSGTVAGATGQFGKGSATLLSAEATACNPFDSADVLLPATQLRLGAIRGQNPPPVPPAGGSISVTVDSSGTVNRATNVATIGGTVSCTGDGTAFFGGILRQISRRMFVDGFAAGNVGVCDGTTQRWSIDVLGETGLFNSGSATIGDGLAQVCDDVGCTAIPVNATVQLRASGKRPPFGAPPAGQGSPALVVNVDRTGSLDTATNTATIGGTVTCAGDFGSMFITVRQLAGRVYIDGFTSIDLGPCDGIPHAWSAAVAGFSGRFRAGWRDRLGRRLRLWDGLCRHADQRGHSIACAKATSQPFVGNDAPDPLRGRDRAARRGL